MNNSVEPLILFNEGHQGLLELHVHFAGVCVCVCVCVCVEGGGRGEFPVWGKRGLCYVALLQGSPEPAGFHYGNLIYGIFSYSVKPLKAHW